MLKMHFRFLAYGHPRAFAQTNTFQVRNRKTGLLSLIKKSDVKHISHPKCKTASIRTDPASCAASTERKPSGMRVNAPAISISPSFLPLSRYPTPRLGIPLVFQRVQRDPKGRGGKVHTRCFFALDASTGRTWSRTQQPFGAGWMFVENAATRRWIWQFITGWRISGSRRCLFSFRLRPDRPVGDQSGHHSCSQTMDRFNAAELEQKRSRNAPVFGLPK